MKVCAKQQLSCGALLREGLSLIRHEFCSLRRMEGRGKRYRRGTAKGVKGRDGSVGSWRTSIEPKGESSSSTHFISAALRTLGTRTDNRNSPMLFCFLYLIASSVCLALFGLGLPPFNPSADGKLHIIAATSIGWIRFQGVRNGRRMPLDWNTGLKS